MFRATKQYVVGIKRTFTILFLALIATSCASLFNSKYIAIEIKTNKPAKINVNNDSTFFYVYHHHLAVNRSKNPLIITTITDSITKTTIVKAKNSFFYWLNLYPALWPGFLIDKNNPRRYTYPQLIYINVDSKDTIDYKTIIPLDAADAKFKNILKFTPLKLVGLSNSSIEFSYERKLSKYFSSEIVCSYLLPNNLIEAAQGFDHKTKGFMAAFEEKYYYKNTAPYGPYISLEVKYLKNKYYEVASFEAQESFYNPQARASYLDTFGINKQTFSINIKWGYQYIKNRFAIDFYVGFGLRYKDVSHFDRRRPNDFMELPIDLNAFYITNKEGKYWTIDMPLNIRIGYTF